jgi:hypothetical protein
MARTRPSRAVHSRRRRLKNPGRRRHPARAWRKNKSFVGRRHRLGRLARDGNARHRLRAGRRRGVIKVSRSRQPNDPAVEDRRDRGCTSTGVNFFQSPPALAGHSFHGDQHSQQQRRRDRRSAKVQFNPSGAWQMLGDGNEAQSSNGISRSWPTRRTSSIRSDASRSRRKLAFYDQSFWEPAGAIDDGQVRNRRGEKVEITVEYYSSTPAYSNSGSTEAAESRREI